VVIDIGEMIAGVGNNGRKGECAARDAKTGKSCRRVGRAEKLITPTKVFENIEGHP
jgi:hypothetical protein